MKNQPTNSISTSVRRLPALLLAAAFTAPKQVGINLVVPIILLGGIEGACLAPAN